MAERKSGAVKPPVIDLKAREAAPRPIEPQAALDLAPEATPPEAAAVPAPSEAVAAPTPKPRTRTAKPPPAAQPESPAEPEAAPPDAPSPAPEPPPAPPETAPPEARFAPEPTPAAAEPDGLPPMPPRPPARLAMPWSAIAVAAGVGALGGTALTYLVAGWLALPDSRPTIADPAAAIVSLDEQADALAQQLTALEDRATDTQVSLDATIMQMDTGFGDLRTAIEGVRAGIVPPAPVDLSAIEAELRTLEQRVGAIAAGASSADASALAEDLVGIEQGIATLGSRLETLEAGTTETRTTIAALETEIEAAKSSIAAQSQTLGGADIGPAVKLPLLVSGLESAMSAGRAYGDELLALTTLLPDLAVPPSLAASAGTGLAHPDAIAGQLAEAVPAILAARTAQSTGDWATDALEWAKALLALRPTGEQSGDTPEAMVSRLEAAVSRRDFAGAAELLEALPEPMRAAAGTVGADIRALAEADAFIASLRSRALAPAAEGVPETAETAS